MARKFLQMGYSRSRRYANGKKYDGAVPKDRKGQSGVHDREKLALVLDLIKAESAAIFYESWQQIKKDKTYCRMIIDYKKN